MQRRRHIDAGIIPVCAFEADISGGEIGANALQENAQRDAGPFADHAPALDANMPRHLRFLRQSIQLLQAPGRAAVDEPGETELVGYRIDFWNDILAARGGVANILPP